MNLRPDTNQTSANTATCSTCVLPFEGGELLVEVWSTGNVHVAWRKNRWETWSPGVHGKLKPD